MTTAIIRPRNVLYRCWTETTDELARVLFFNLYGREPAEVYREGQYVYAGPVVVEVEAVAVTDQAVTQLEPAPVVESQLQLF